MVPAWLPQGSSIWEAYDAKQGKRSRGEKWWEEGDGNGNNCTVEQITDLLHGNTEFRLSSKVQVGASDPQLGQGLKCEFGSIFVWSFSLWAYLGNVTLDSF